MSGGFSLASFALSFDADPGQMLRALGVALALVFALLVARRHRARPMRALALALLRAGALLLALFLLHRPELSLTGARRIPDRLLLLVDDSASMELPVAPATPGAPPPPTRREAAFARAAALQDAPGGFRIEALRVGDRPAPHRAADPPRAGLTDLSAALLAEQVNAAPPDAILLLSDGRITKGMPAAALAARLPAPLYAWCVGAPLPLSDLSLDGIVHEAEVFVGEEVPVRLHLRRRQVARDEAEVRLFDARGETLARDIARFEPGSAETTFTLNFRPDEPGEFALGAECVPFPGEEIAANNRRMGVVAVAARDLKVLLLSAHPRPDALFVKRILASRRGVELTDLTLMGGAFLDGATGQPAAPPAELAPYRLVVLDQPDARPLPAPFVAALLERVRTGAGILVLGGPRLHTVGSNLDWLLPCPGPHIHGATPAPFHLTDAGAAHPVTQLSRSGELTRLIFGDLPPLPGRVQSGPPRPGTLTLLTAGKDGPPLLTLGRFGTGKLAFLSGDGLAALFLRPPLLARTRLHAESLLSRLVAHLTAAEAEGFRIRLARPVLATGEPARLFADLPGGGTVRLRLRDDAGKIHFERTLAVPASEGGARDEFTPERAGAYTVEASAGAATASARLFVEPPAEEWREPSPDRDALALLANRSGGLLLTDATVAEAARLIPRRNRSEPVALRIPLHDLPPLFFLLLLLLTLEWGARKWWRLE